MNEKTDAQLMRLIAGELEAEEAAALELKVERDPELTTRLRELEASWRGLELPPPSPVPVGLRSRIVARAQEIERQRQGIDWGPAPTWARVGAAMALAAGIVLGVGVSAFEPDAVAATVTEQIADEAITDWSLTEPGLAELYAEALEQTEWAQEKEGGS